MTPVSNQWISLDGLVSKYYPRSQLLNVTDQVLHGTSVTNKTIPLADIQVVMWLLLSYSMGYGLQHLLTVPHTLL